MTPPALVGTADPAATGFDGRPERRLWIFLALSGLATAVSWVAYFKALSIGSATPVTAIDKASLVVTMVLAMVFLGERPSWTGGLGVALIVGGAILASLETR